MSYRDDVFDSDEQACNVLGHEMSHALIEYESALMDTRTDLDDEESVCDYVGAFLAKLAEMTAGYEAERIFREMDPGVKS